MSPQDSSGRQQGTLAEWDDARGFGFIAPDEGGSRLFVHVSAFPQGRRPATGRAVTYTETRDQSNRLRAAAVRYVSGTSTDRLLARGVPMTLAIAFLFLAGLAGLAALDEVPFMLVGIYILLSVVAIAMFAEDKSAAEQGRWRIPENSLHLLSIAGGWPGALVARQMFRHKTTKQPFRTVFWLSVIANCVALAWLVSRAPLTLP